MTVEELCASAKELAWFTRLGEPDISSRYVRIPSLAPWANQNVGDLALDQIADQMDWLPTTRDQDDPIHGNSLQQRSEALGKKQEFSQKSLEVYKAAITALRTFDGHPALTVGPHDFTEAARGAALFHDADVAGDPHRRERQTATLENCEGILVSHAEAALMHIISSRALVSERNQPETFSTVIKSI